jgi:SAM-dependent methyltransferase
MSSNPKDRIAAAYHAAADSYDDPALSFWQYYGEQTVSRACILPGEIVLDVCSGSGASALPAARTVGPVGRVIGLDIAPNLIALAREKAAAASLTNVEFRQADFDQAYFRNASFDAVICVFGLFFFPVMPATLQKMWRILKPGGRLAITTWGPGLFEPGATVFWNAVRDVRPELYKGFNPWDSLTTPDAVRAVFEQAGLPAPEIEAEDRRLVLESPESLWTVVMGTGYRGTIEQLAPNELEHVRAACLSLAAREIAIPALYAGLIR